MDSLKTTFHVSSYTFSLKKLPGLVLVFCGLYYLGKKKHVTCDLRHLKDAPGHFWQLYVEQSIHGNLWQYWSCPYLKESHESISREIPSSSPSLEHKKASKDL